MITYAVANYGDRFAVLKVDSSGPSYHVIAVCTSESDANAIVAALS